MARKNILFHIRYHCFSSLKNEEFFNLMFSIMLWVNLSKKCNNARHAFIIQAPTIDVVNAKPQ